MVARSCPVSRGNSVSALPPASVIGAIASSIGLAMSSVITVAPCAVPASRSARCGSAMTSFASLSAIPAASSPPCHQPLSSVAQPPASSTPI